MLARLLRWIILVLCLIGGALGYFLAPLPMTREWNALLLAVLWPFLTLMLIEMVAATKSRAQEPWGVWWRALLGEYVAGIHVFLFRQPWTLATPSILPATGLPHRVPVVLVHGYLCNHRIWDDMATALRAQGHTVLAVNLEPLFTSIDHYAAIVDNAVTALCQHTGTSKVALVGHSMGGLAIRAWMRAHGSQKAARVLTLGTPHVGTQIDFRPRTPNSNQMTWNSAWLTELTASETVATRALIRIAITPQDNIVYPQRVQTLAEVATSVFEGIGHVQLCLEAPVISWVCEHLTELASTTATLSSPPARHQPVGAVAARQPRTLPRDRRRGVSAGRQSDGF